MNLAWTKSKKAALLTALVCAALPAVHAGSPHADLAPAGTHCVTRASDPSSTACFPTFASAIFFATGGGLVVDESFRPDELTQELLSGSSSESSVVLGIGYMDADYGGSSNTWTESSGCGTYWYSPMPSGWNDVISSFKSFSGCHTRLYEHTGWTGASVACTPDCSYVGDAMNDRASSLMFSTSV